MSSAVLELIGESVADWATSTDAMRHVPGLLPSGPVPPLPVWVEPPCALEQFVPDGQRGSVADA